MPSPFLYNRVQDKATDLVPLANAIVSLEKSLIMWNSVDAVDEAPASGAKKWLALDHSSSGMKDEAERRYNKLWELTCPQALWQMDGVSFY